LFVAGAQAWHLVGVNTTTWRSRLLAPNHAGKTTPLEGILIAITVGAPGGTGGPGPCANIQHGHVAMPVALVLDIVVSCVEH
jgi:hypothetical protein